MIVTFYSFKGGVGRSFSLLETALQLASRGHSVVVWDLDLEAPGLQKIPLLQTLERDLTIGTLDLLLDFQASDFKYPSEGLKNAVVSLPLPENLAAAGGRLSFLLPSRLDGDYTEKFGAIRWAELFQRSDGVGHAFFYKTASSLIRDLGYEIVLIDSRTGYTDLSAVCTLQIPDLVILVFNFNEQNLAGIERVSNAATQVRANTSESLPVFLLANMVPDGPADLRAKKLAELTRKNLRPHHIIPLRPELLLTDALPTLAGLAKPAEDFTPVVQRIEARKQELENLSDAGARQKLSRARAKADPEELDALRRRGIYEKAKTFEEKVAELFGLSGGRATVDYKRDDMQFDVKVELTMGMFPVYLLIECKDTDRPVTQQQVREFASKVEYAATADRLPYQGMLVARSQFANNAHVAAENLRIQLRTYEQLLLSLVDLRPNVEAAIRAFQGTALERLYVEQDAVLEGEIRTDRPVEPNPLTGTVRRWLDEPGSTFLALLGDFGCGKTSFCKRLACELALESKEKPGTVRTPVLIDLREGGSTTVTLESLLTHHFQRLSNLPFNPQALLHLNREGYLLLIFDGFDETIAYTEPGRYLENLRQILRAAEGKAKVLLTCRTHYFRDRPEALRRLGKVPEVVSTQGATKLYEEIQDRPGSEIGYVLEFREEQIEDYLRKALPPPADWKAFREQIRNTYNLEDLAERPFLLEIIVKTLPRLMARGGEVTIADLYETYCESWFSHADFRLTLTRERKVALVEYLARLIWDSPENRIHYDVLFEKATEFFKDRSLTLHDKERIDYEVRTALFLRRDAEGYYSFIHRSFLEFFIARTLRTGLAAGEPGCLLLKRITREVVFFLEFWPEAKSIPSLTGKVLSGTYQPRVSENALLLLYLHARAQLGPLVGSTRDEVIDLQRLREIFAKMRPEVIHLEGADLSGAVLAGVDLSRANLERSDFTRADLRQASLNGARLGKAKLRFADLRRASAEDADLAEADLSHADAQEATFNGASLKNVDLSFGRFTRAQLKAARLDGIKTIGAGMLGASLPGRTSLAATAGRTDARELSWRFQAGHSGGVQSVAWHPNGYCVASGSSDGTIKLWEPGAGRVLLTLEGHKGSVESVAWAPDGNTLASGSYDNTVRLWDPSDGRLLNTLQAHEHWVRAVSWAPHGNTLASASDDNTVRLWDPSDGRLLNTLKGHERGVRAVAWAPDERIIASGSDDDTIGLWDLINGQLLSTLKGHEGWVLAVSWAPDGKTLASGSSDSTVKLWDTSSRRFLYTLQGHESIVTAISWAPDGKTIASGSYDKTVRLWDANDRRLLYNLQGHKDEVLSVSWAPDGKTIVSGSSDQTLRFWDPLLGRILNTLQGHEPEVLTVSLAPDGKTVASGSYDKAIRLWDTNDGQLLNTFQGHESRIQAVAWSPDGTTLASGSLDQTVRLWNPSDGRLLNALRGDKSEVLAVSWAPDGKTLSSGSSDQTVRLWDTNNGRLLNTLQGHESQVLTVSWASDGRILASGSDDDTVRLWNPLDGRLLNTLQGHESLVSAVSWAPDGKILASGSNDNTVRLWDPLDGRLLSTLQGHENHIRAVTWAPDGNTLASGSLDSTVRLWDPNDGRLIRMLQVGSGLQTLSWERAGRRLVLGFWTGYLEIWDLISNPPRPLARFYNTPNGSGFAVTPDGYVSGPPEALEYVRFGDGWALYDLTDVPERLSPEKVKAALASGKGTAAGSRRRKR